MAYKDPNWHIMTSLKMCDTFKQMGIIDDAIYLRLFLFFNKIQSWDLVEFPALGTITAWEEELA